jgi:AraC-like DNA-binding protein
MRVNPIMRRVGNQSHLFDVVALDQGAGYAGLGWRFRDGEGVGRIDFLQISNALTLDISDFCCFREKHMSLATENAPLLKLRFKLSGCSMLHFKHEDIPMLGEHCSISVYSPNELEHELLTRDIAERSVTLHCDPAFFLQDLGLSADAAPQPIRAFLQRDTIPHWFQRVRMSARMRQATIELMQPSCLPQFARSFREVKARELAISLLDLLAQGQERSSRADQAANRRHCGLSSDKLQQATDWLQSNLGDEADLGKLARMLGDDPLQLARGFRQSTGLSMQQYRLRARVERARQLLIDGQLAIKAVSQDSGFYDQAHLTRCFRAAFGTTPLQYRKQVADKSN